MHDVSYAVVRAYVADRKPKIRVEAGRGPVNVFFPQTHRPGAEAEVDFGEVAVNLRGELVTCMLFAFRLSFSGKAVHKIFASGGSEAFLEGHVHAFTALGGVPTGKIRYDNLRAAVAQVLGFARQRVETARWTAFRSHFAVDPFYCQPGLQGAHEKGGVEGQIGWFRRNHLVPFPRSTRSSSSTPWLRRGTLLMTPGASAAGPTPSGSCSPSSSRCWRRCRTSRSRPASGWVPASTDTARSPSAPTATRCRRGLSAGRSGSTCTPPTWSSTTAAPKWPGTNG